MSRSYLSDRAGGAHASAFGYVRVTVIGAERSTRSTCATGDSHRVRHQDRRPYALRGDSPGIDLRRPRTGRHRGTRPDKQP